MKQFLIISLFLVGLIGFEGCKKEEVIQPEPPLEVSFKLDSITNQSHSTGEFYLLYTFGYAKDKILEIKEYAEDGGLFKTAIFEGGRLIRMEYAIHKYFEEYEYLDGKIIVRRTVDNNKYFVTEHIYLLDKITETHHYLKDRVNDISIYYYYKNDNIDKTSHHYHIYDGIQDYEKGPYDEYVNPWSFYFMPGYEYTYSKNNQLLDYVELVYDDDNRLAATITNGLETRFHYR